MTSEEFRAACALIAERGVEGFDPEVNLAVMALAEAVEAGDLVLRDDRRRADPPVEATRGFRRAAVA
ncbi:MAG: hypothetical protein AAF322_08025 [Pseudomonadota bacterium]